jgi:hypothetical protein
MRASQGCLKSTAWLVRARNIWRGSRGSGELECSLRKAWRKAQSFRGMCLAPMILLDQANVHIKGSVVNSGSFDERGNKVRQARDVELQ